MAIATDECYRGYVYIKQSVLGEPCIYVSNRDLFVF